MDTSDHSPIRYKKYEMPTGVPWPIMLHAKVAAYALMEVAELRQNTVCVVKALDIFAHVHEIGKLKRRQILQREKTSEAIRAIARDHRPPCVKNSLAP